MCVPAKKSRKQSALIGSAYELFSSKGITETSIDDIVKKAKVAKGTFYLYFKDKFELLDRIVAQKSTVVIISALNELDTVSQQQKMPFADRVIFFIDHIIRYFQKDKAMLKILYKNLTKGLYVTEEAKAAVERFCEDYQECNGSPDSALQMLHLIVEMVGAACYRAIIEEYPYTMDTIQPILYQAVRKMLC